MILKDLNMILDVMKEVKEFDDSAEIELIGGAPSPVIGGSTGVVVRFKDGNIDVELRSDISRLLGKERG